MGEMREWWANVRLYEGPWAGVGNRRETREACEAATALSPVLPAYRLHVRLKPEGAPKRYGSQGERYFWEHFPETAREYPAAAANIIRVPPQPPRTPKKEDSAT